MAAAHCPHTHRRHRASSAPGPCASLGDDRRSGVTILHPGGSDRDGQQQAPVSTTRWRLRPLTFLPASNPVSPSRGRAARALRIYDRSGRLWRLADAIKPLRAQSVVQGLERTGRSPAAEGLVDRLPRRKRLAQQSPRATRAQGTTAGGDHPAALIACRRSASAVALEQVSSPSPLGIGQIGVHAACPVGAVMSRGVPVARRLRTLNGRPLTGPARRLEPLDARFSQRLAYRRRCF